MFPGLIHRACISPCYWKWLLILWAGKTLVELPFFPARCGFLSPAIDYKMVLLFSAIVLFFTLSFSDSSRQMGKYVERRPVKVIKPAVYSYTTTSPLIHFLHLTFSVTEDHLHQAAWRRPKNRRFVRFSHNYTGCYLSPSSLTLLHPDPSPYASRIILKPVVIKPASNNFLKVKEKNAVAAGFWTTDHWKRRCFLLRLYHKQRYEQKRWKHHSTKFIDLR